MRQMSDDVQPGLLVLHGNRTELLGEAVFDWLARQPRPLGVFACYDGRAQHVLEACQSRGWAVPDEIAVIGVDNDEVLCDLCTPPLSSVQPNARRTGYEAAAILSGHGWRNVYVMEGGVMAWPYPREK